MDDFSIEVVIEKVLRYCRVDGDTKKNSNSAFSREGFDAALFEDMQRLEEAFDLSAGSQEVGEGGCDWDVEGLSVAEAVKSVREKESPFNWLLLAPKTKANGMASMAFALKSVETKDTSGPKIEEKIHVKPNPFSAVKEQLNKAASGEGDGEGLGRAWLQDNLKKVKEGDIHDKSAPSIDLETKVGANPFAAVKAQLCHDEAPQE